MNDLNSILEKVDIIDVVSSYIDLERKGRNYFGVCPFHDDTNPSMSVSIEKQIYKCFSCGAGGNAIDFVMNIENVGFKEALTKVAASVNIVIDNSFVKQVDDYFAIYESAVKFFSYNLLHTESNQSYLSYLLNRGFDLEVIEHFKIGVPNNKFVEHLKANYSDVEVAKTVLINSSGNLMFRNRVLFPISNIKGDVVGFSGRVIDASTPKYLNTSETKYFKKSEILYNFYEASQFIKSKKSVIITEGFFDVMRLYSVGIENAVATMGTSFSPMHAKMISNLVSNVYINLDSDEAGIKASLNVFNTLQNYDVRVFMVKLDEGDPDEFVYKYGVDKYLAKLETSKVFEEYYLGSLLENYLDLGIGGKEEVIEKVTHFVNSITNDVTRQLLSEYVTSKTGVIISSVNIRRKPVESNVVKTDSGSIAESLHKAFVTDSTAINKIENEFIYMMLNSKNAIEFYVNDIKSMNIAANEEMAMLVKEFYVQSEYTHLSEFIVSRKSDYSKEQLDTLLNMSNRIQSMSFKVGDEIILDYVKLIINNRYDKQIEALQKTLKSETDDNLKKNMLTKINLLRRERDNIRDNIIESRRV